MNTKLDVYEFLSFKLTTILKGMGIYLSVICKFYKKIRTDLDKDIRFIESFF